MSSLKRDGSGEDAATVSEDAEAIDSTERSLRVRLYDVDETRWIPRSVIHDDSEVYEHGHTGTLVLKHWFAQEEGLLP